MNILREELKNNQNNGFSLIELVIVLAILGVAAAIAAPSFMAYRDNSNLKEAVREISSDIQMYKQKTVSENIRYRIAFIAATNKYTIQRETAGVWGNVTAKTVGVGHSNIKILGDPTFVDDTITFQTRGTANAGQLQLQHTKRLSKATITTSMMGRVRVEYELE